MNEIVYEEIKKSSEEFKLGNEINIAGVHCMIHKIVTNSHDELVLHLAIANAKYKTRSQMMLIIPKKIPVTTLES
jgi:phage FluMu gp28-like protein